MDHSDTSVGEAAQSVHAQDQTYDRRAVVALALISPLGLNGFGSPRSYGISTGVLDDVLREAKEWYEILKGNAEMPANAAEAMKGIGDAIAKLGNLGVALEQAATALSNGMVSAADKIDPLGIKEIFHAYQKEMQKNNDLEKALGSATAALNRVTQGTKSIDILVPSEKRPEGFSQSYSANQGESTMVSLTSVNAGDQKCTIRIAHVRETPIDARCEKMCRKQVLCGDRLFFIDVYSISGNDVTFQVLIQDK